MKSILILKGKGLIKMNKGRFTVVPEKDVTVFLIGVHINKPLQVHKWLPVILAMPAMLKELSNHKSIGCLSFEMFFKYKGVNIIQYWDSNESLLTYSKMPKHLKAWKRFSKQLKGNNAVGFYHETYNVKENNYENIYLNMPNFGLGKAVSPQEVTTRTHSAKQRLQVNQ